MEKYHFQIINQSILLFLLLLLSLLLLLFIKGIVIEYTEKNAISKSLIKTY